MRHARAFALALAVLVAGGGCSSAPATEVRRPPVYPDRASAEGAWETFLWAWRTGDVDTLARMLSLWLKEDLDRKVEKNGKAAVAAWYRKDAESLVISDARWVKRSSDLAYLDARLARPGEEPFDVRFSFLKRDDGWTVSGNRPTVIEGGGR